VLSARAVVRSLKEYHPPLSGRRGLRLDFNENTQGASPRVISRLRELTLEELARYPEREPVERRVADFLGVSPPETLLTNGVDEGIHLLCQTFLQEGDEAVIVVPTFAMYELLAASAGAKVIAVPAARNFEFPTEEVIAQITERTRLIAVANPNNPTGAVATREQLLRVALAAPRAAVLVDEAISSFTVSRCCKTFAMWRISLWRAHSPKPTEWRDCASACWWDVSRRCGWSGKWRRPTT
jgi:histidinol-phosphate aminotransferase